MKINNDFIKEKVGNECVLVPTGADCENGIFNLNETAERIFDLLNNGRDRNEIVELLCDEYEADRETIEKFTDEFILKLIKSGILLD